MYYRYTQKWVDLFHDEPSMTAIESIHYIKGLHNLLNAHFDLKNYEKFDKSLKAFEKFADSDAVQRSENNRVQVFVYLNTARINRHFMHGSDQVFDSVEGRSGAEASVWVVWRPLSLFV